MRYLQGSSKRRWWRSQPGKPHPSEPGEPRLAAPISRRLPLARAGRAQDLPASFASPCFAPTFYTVGNYPPRLPCLTTNSPQHPKRAIGVAQPGRAIPPLQAILPTEHAHDPVTSPTAGASAPACDLATARPGSKGRSSSLWTGTRASGALWSNHSARDLQRAELPAQMSHDLDAHCVTYGPNGTRAH